LAIGSWVANLPNLGYLGLLKRLFQTFQYPAFINKYIFWLILELLGTDGLKRRPYGLILLVLVRMVLILWERAIALDDAMREIKISAPLLQEAKTFLQETLLLGR